VAEQEKDLLYQVVTRIGRPQSYSQQGVAGHRIDDIVLGASSFYIANRPWWLSGIFEALSSAVLMANM
jgi:hypothetical protein